MMTQAEFIAKWKFPSTDSFTEVSYLVTMSLASNLSDMQDGGFRHEHANVLKDLIFDYHSVVRGQMEAERELTQQLSQQ